MRRLGAAELAAALAAAPAWRLEGPAIVREDGCGSFARAIAWVSRVAALAEAAGHHPEIRVRYDRVRLELTTHDAGGLTQLDFDLARALDAAAAVTLAEG